MLLNKNRRNSFMRLLFAGVIGVLVIFYVFTYMRYKKRNKKRTDSVSEFKKNYHRINLQKKSGESDGYTKYITKYNSPVDFIDKEEFLKNAAKSDGQTKYRDY